jgi:cobalamin biosynthesis Co2+ chelatase CbiK
MQALERYKVSSGRKFPTCSEILEVLRSIGYEKIQVRSIHAVATLDELERVVEEELS